MDITKRATFKVLAEQLLPVWFHIFLILNSFILLWV
jgi:hypothetical protein